MTKLAETLVRSLIEDSVESRFLGVIELHRPSVHEELRKYWYKEYGNSRVARGFASYEAGDPQGPLDTDVQLVHDPQVPAYDWTTFRQYLLHHPDKCAMITQVYGMSTAWFGKREDLERLSRVAAKLAFEHGHTDDERD